MVLLADGGWISRRRVLRLGMPFAVGLFLVCPGKKRPAEFGPRVPALRVGVSWTNEIATDTALSSVERKLVSMWMMKSGLGLLRELAR